MESRRRGQLRGARILVVEDEALIAMLIEDLLAGFGCEVLGPAPRLSVALKLARESTVNGAILDVNIGGEPVHPVAEVLAERRIPFLFATGYGETMIDGRFTGHPVLAKPFKPADLRDALTRLLAQS